MMVKFLLVGSLLFFVYIALLVRRYMRKRREALARNAVLAQQQRDALQRYTYARDVSL